MSKNWKIALAVAGALILISYTAIVVIAIVAFVGAGGGGDRVAVIRITGLMSSSGISGGLLGEAGTTAEQVIDELEQAEDDPSVKAIILRIDSPGGTAASGQEIYSAVKKVDKPVVASIADMGASAAYWAACGAEEIIAGPASEVGSIGVIVSVPNYKGLMEKLGISYVTISKGKYKTLGDPNRAMTDEEKKIIEDQMDIVYRQFIDDVASGRSMAKADVEKLADGLAWPGSEALKMKLVDRLGNWRDAVDRAAELGKIEGKPELVEYTDYSPFDFVRALFEGKAPGLEDLLSTGTGRQLLSR